MKIKLTEKAKIELQRINSIDEESNEFVEYLNKIAPDRLSQTTKNWMQLCHQQAEDSVLEWREPNRPERL